MTRAELVQRLRDTAKVMEAAAGSRPGTRTTICPKTTSPQSSNSASGERRAWPHFLVPPVMSDDCSQLADVLLSSRRRNG